MPLATTAALLAMLSIHNLGNGSVAVTVAVAVTVTVAVTVVSMLCRWPYVKFTTERVDQGKCTS